MDLPSRPSEEIFVALNFGQCSSKAAPTVNDLVLTHARHNVDTFCGFYFCDSQTLCENHEILHHAKISHYHTYSNGTYDPI